MVVRFEPFKEDHLRGVVLQDMQKREYDFLYNDAYRSLWEQSTICLTGWHGPRCLGAAGVLPVSRFRGVGWGIFGDLTPRQWVSVRAKVRRVVEALAFKRVEFYVDVSFPTSASFLAGVGARLETPEPLRWHGVEGQDQLMYAITKD